MNTRKKSFTRVSQLEVVGIGPSSYQKKRCKGFSIRNFCYSLTNLGYLITNFKINNSRFFRYRSFSTTPKEPQLSHYGRRVMVSSFQSPISNRFRVTDENVFSSNDPKKILNFWSSISLFTIICVQMCLYMSR